MRAARCSPDSAATGTTSAYEPAVFTAARPTNRRICGTPARCSSTRSPYVDPPWPTSPSTRAASGGVITRAQLESFQYDGEQLKLIDQSRGIRNPRQLAATLSILSQPNGPYDDVETEDGLLRYAYRDGDPNGG